MAVEEEKERENGFGVFVVDEFNNAVVVVLDCNATGFCRAAIVVCFEERREREWREKIGSEEVCGERVENDGWRF